MALKPEKTLFYFFYSCFFVLLISCSGFLRADASFPESRNVLEWPFSQTSIWNMPIGSGAEYIPQPIKAEHVNGTMADMNIIVLEPNAELMNIYGTEYRWQQGTNPTTRCEKRNDIVHLQLPIPKDYVTTFMGQIMPNNPATVLSRDGRTLIQTQPFQACSGGYATTGLHRYDGKTIDDILRSEDIDIYGDGTYGMQGGSGLSSMGGAIRVGELSPGPSPIRHALKMSFPGEHYLYYDHDQDVGYRWPAVKHDSNAARSYQGDLPEAKIGVLRAIPRDVDINDLDLETEPGRKIAWTLQNYGAYQVEEVPWSKIEIGVEDGPRGSVPVDFKKDWGYEFISKDEDDNPWYRDILKVIAQLHIVANNSPDSIGGGGVPLQPLAPPFLHPL